LQAQIRKDRKKAIYDQEQRRQEIMNAIGIILAVCVIAGVLIGGFIMAIDIFGHPRTW
jgi:hypothetical protein